MVKKVLELKNCHIKSIKAEDSRTVIIVNKNFWQLVVVFVFRSLISRIMMKLDNLSVEQMPNCVDLFNSKPTLVGLEHASFVEYPTLTPITDGPIHFRINTGLCFVDFSKSFLVTTFRITRKEGDKYVNIDKTDPVSLINGFGATFIQNFKVQFNQRPVYNEDLYAYNAYMR